jgi:putative salt-induced outer membrane protein YdiY
MQRARTRPGAVGLSVGLLLLPAAAAAQTILNVERLQPGDVEGWHYGVEGEFSLSRGNTEYVDLLSGVVLGHRWSGDWLRMFVGLDYRSETGEGLENDRYLHVRHNHWWAERWQSFHFVQYQASHDGYLRRRALVGTGVRRRLVDGTTTLDVGSGAMYEREDLDGARVTGDHPLEARVWRMANLVVATRQLSESVRLLGVAYVQPDLADFGDLRTLTDLSLLVALTEQVGLTLRGEWRRDSRPPGDRKRDDVVFRTGITVSFR